MSIDGFTGISLKVDLALDGRCSFDSLVVVGVAEKYLVHIPFPAK